MADHVEHISLNGSARRFGAAFAAACLVLMLVPFVGMFFAPTTESTENRTLAELPELASDGSLNTEFLQDAGAYFDDHFALRNYLVDANAHIRSLLGSPANDQVILGSDGWMYYIGTAVDYTQLAPLSDRMLFNIAHNLSLMQSYAKSRGAEFVFAVAPNKNSLYPQYMPNMYLRGEGQSNWERLKPYLDAAGVSYIDLFELLGSQDADAPLYYLRDTHWNNRGALLAADALLERFGYAGSGAARAEWIERVDAVGDIATMLYPLTAEPEAAAYALGYNDGENLSGSLWRYTAGSDVTDDIAATTATAEGRGSLVMYRDSFANALVPYLSPEFARASYSKMIPYALADIDAAQATCVIVERAERHIDYLGQSPFIMYAPMRGFDERALSSAVALDTESVYVELSEDNGLLRIDGYVDDPSIESNATISILLRDAHGTMRSFEAFTISFDGVSYSTDYGFAAYIAQDFEQALQQPFTIYVDNPNGADMYVEANIGNRNGD